MTQVDMVIRGGTVADGTGGPLYEADIAINDGQIVGIGKIGESGREEISAKGLLVTPGFIDVHTHYDGQLTWSDQLSPSSSHGVTTVVTGNCGVGFAPCRPEDRDSLVRIMEGVEDIPEIVMTEGLPWDWESFGDYLGSVEHRPHDIDFAVLQAHTPLRLFVMGQRALDLEPATEADMAKMRLLAKAAIEAGASGFSTSRNIFHRASDGSYLPTLKAEEAELLAIAQGLNDAGRGVIQGTVVDKYLVEDYELMHRVAAKSGRPVSYTLIEIDGAKKLWREVAAAVARDNAAGADIKMQVFNRPVGLILGLEASLNPFSTHPYYAEHLADLPVAERIMRMRDPIVRDALLKTADQSDHPYGPTTRSYDQMFIMGEMANYEPEPSTSVAALAAARNVQPTQFIYDALIANEGRSKFFVASTNYSERNLDITLEMMRLDNAVVALGDGGAHYGVICDASYSTFMLTHWVRDRTRGERLDLAEAVHMLTDAPAQLQRFKDRGRIAPGMKADINIIDMDRLKLFSPHIANDLPAGAKRLSQKAEGYVATIVSGVPIRRDGEDTGARPGRLVR